jgi:hypothetical protein
MTKALFSLGFLVLVSSTLANVGAFMVCDSKARELYNFYGGANVNYIDVNDFSENNKARTDIVRDVCTAGANSVGDKSHACSVH